MEYKQNLKIVKLSTCGNSNMADLRACYEHRSVNRLGVMKMCKATRMYQAYLKMNNLSASADSYENFLSAIKDYNTFCEIEKQSNMTKHDETRI